MNINDIKYIIKLGRLPLIATTLILYILGIIFALVLKNSFDLSRFIVGIAIATTALLSMSYCNNYYDAEADQYNKPTAFSGGSGQILHNQKLRTSIKYLSIVFMAFSILLAFIFVLIFSFSIVFLVYVIAGNLLAWFYTAPPLKLVYHGLGEITTVIAVGFMIPGLGYYVFAGQLDYLFLIFIFPFMMFLGAWIINAEIPDLKGDRQGNKKTVIVRKGYRFGLILASIFSITATLYYIIISNFNVLPSYIDLRIFALFSMLPLIFILLSLRSSLPNRNKIMKIVNGNIGSIFIFIILVIGYLIFIIS
ncbi:MAG: prenyltransferase [Candidatus Hodarchaeota archaeon]